MQKKYSKKGFTLLEMVLAITVFVIFLTATSTSYLSLAAAMRDANQERIVYSTAQEILKMLSDEIRNSVPDYSCYENEKTDCQAFGLKGVNDIVLLNKEGNKRFMVRYDDGKLLIKKRIKIERFDREDVWNDDLGFANWVEYELPSNVYLEDLKFNVTPTKNPFVFKNAADSHFQFQPKVSIFMNFSTNLQRKADYKFPVQTTVSSRVYDKIS